jgi:hypothetical protein
MKKILIFITLCSTISYVHTMELVINNNENHKNNIGKFEPLPDECLNKIIFYNKPKTIGALKNSCKYFALHASILKANEHFMLHCMNNKRIRSLMFKTIIATDNAECIQKTIECCKIKPEPLNSDSVIIIITEPTTQESLFEQAYLYELLQQAIQQNKPNATAAILDTCGNNIPSYKDGTWLHYAAKHNNDNAIKALLTKTSLITDTKNSTNHTALYIAWEKNNQEAMAALTVNEDDENNIKRFNATESVNSCARCIGICVAISTLSAIAGIIIGVAVPSALANTTTT